MLKTKTPTELLLLAILNPRMRGAISRELNRRAAMKPTVMPQKLAA